MAFFKIQNQIKLIQIYIYSTIPIPSYRRCPPPNRPTRPPPPTRRRPAVACCRLPAAVCCRRRTVDVQLSSSRGAASCGGCLRAALRSGRLCSVA
jgi:hypothetical protein